MATSLKSNHQNDLKGDVIVFIIFIGFIAFIIYIFNHYNGTKYIQDTWNSWFAMRNKTVVSENKLPPEKKTNTANCRRVYNGTTDKFEEICTICPNVWSVSQRKYVYECATKEELRLQTLSDCSKNSREKLTESATSLKSVGDLEKLRELLMKMCMQEAGFDY